MKTTTKWAGRAAAGLAGAIFAFQANAAIFFGSDMYIDVSAIGAPVEGDADTLTDVFTQFGFTQTLATSIYDFSDGSILGPVNDTNDPTVLGAIGAPLPSPGQRDIDALAPLQTSIIPFDDIEGFGTGTGWGLTVDIDINGVVKSLTEVEYVSGTFTVNRVVAGVEGAPVLTFTVTGSEFQDTVLFIDLELTSAIPGFLYVSNGSTFIDVANAIAAGNNPIARLDTDVDPPVPGPGDLTFTTLNGNPIAWRQTTLDGSVGVRVPAPATLALFGLGLVGAGLRGARRKS